MTARWVAAAIVASIVPTLVHDGRASEVVIRLHRERGSAGPLPVLRSGKWGYINASGPVAIEPRFEDAGFFYEGRAAVRANGQWGYIDTTGRQAIPPRFTTATRFSDGLAHVRWAVPGAERMASDYIDSAGRVVFHCEPGDPDVQLTAARCGRAYSEGFVAEAVEVFRCLDEPGNPKEYPCRATLIDRWGYYDKSGKLAIPGPFHSGGSRFSGGLAAAQRYGDKLIGFIGPSGEFVIAAQYD